MTKLRVLDLFSGIGGFSLGLERTGGFETVAFCEIEPFPRKVLAKHWPEVPCYEDVRTLTAGRLAADGIAVDVICGGFPCQDISCAGNGAGLEGERSGLWSEIARLAGELRPQFIIVENVAALLGRGLGTVLGDLAALGFDAEWHCIPASSVGAHHRRDRVWIVAYPARNGREGRSVGDQDGNSYSQSQFRVWGEPARSGTNDNSRALADATRELRYRSGPSRNWRNEPANRGEALADASFVNEQGVVASFLDPQEWARQVERSSGPCGDGFGGWGVEPDVGRVANGVPDRAHRLKALGNAVVPQIPELIGRAILASTARAA